MLLKVCEKIERQQSFIVFLTIIGAGYKAYLHYKNKMNTEYII